MRNLIKTMIFVFVIQLCYAQTIKTYPAIIVIEKDTLVCFTTEQSKQIAVWNEQRKECVELRKNDNQKILKQASFPIWKMRLFSTSRTLKIKIVYCLSVKMKSKL